MTDVSPELADVLTSVRTLRTRIHDAARSSTALASSVATLARKVERLALMKEDMPQLGERLDRLAGGLRAETVAPHLARVLSEVQVAGNPAPHVFIDEVLPGELYQSLVDAIPPPAFFEASAGASELVIPPPMAPIAELVAWRFFKAVVDDVLVPQLVTRLVAGPDGADGYMASHHRLILRHEGCEARTVTPQQEHLLSVVINLAREHDSEEFGSEVRDGAVDASAFPFRPNSALVLIGHRGSVVQHAIPGAVRGVERVSYDFRVRSRASAGR